jgi:superfamily I DNA/RNA helicase|tara:strand:+ start:2589 stop:4082 length:1494 start_codon:yes stop_codon:yes gene_type:complete
MTWNVVLGPPGTGKTTYLLSKVEEHLEKGTPPDRLGYLAFTKKAANEALDRAMDKFDYSPDDLPYFRTLHSLCYRWLGFNKNDVLARSDLRDLSIKIGEKINSAWDGENLMSLSSSGDEMLFLENMARNKLQDYRSAWNESAPDISFMHFDWFVRNYKAFKQSNFLIDYTDMLDMFCSSPDKPKLEVLIIDEAQDLSALQWQCVAKLAEGVEHVYIAGDDDQAIYKWAGADVNQFINLEGKLTYLKQSYRVPRKVHDVALRIVKRIGNRKEKVWEPRSLEGTVNRHVSFEHIDMSVGEWLVLARNNYLLTQVEEHLRKVGKVYEKNSKPSVSPILLNAILDWERLRKGERVQADKIRKIYGYMRAGKEVRRGFKTLKTAVGDEMLSIQDLKRVYGLMVDTIWHECFKLIGNTQREYLISCLRNNEKLSESKIRLNTIHASKGGESENVVILSDMARRSYDELYTNPDNECRTFYVGVTRTKNNLHLVNGKTRREFIF